MPSLVNSRRLEEGNCGVFRKSEALLFANTSPLRMRSERYMIGTWFAA